MVQAVRNIVTEVHDEPHLEGRRVTVRRIQGLVEGTGMDAHGVADQYDLDIADVYAALQYYHTHPDEMTAVTQRKQEREAAAREQGGLSLSELQADRRGSDDVSDSR